MARAASGPSFAEWRRDAPDVSDEAYPPRADVGRYLLDGFRKVLASAPESLIIHDLVRDGDRDRTDRDWLEGRSNRPIASTTKSWSQPVMPTTGTAPSGWRPAPDGMSVTSVFPVERLPLPRKDPCGHDRCDPRLRAHDDRRFACADGGPRRAVRRGAQAVSAALRRRRPTRWPRILPYSRTGRPMLAKPDPAKGFGSADLERIAARAREELIALPAGSPVSSAAAIVLNVAEHSLRSVDPPNGEVTVMASRVEDALAGRATPSDASAHRGDRAVNRGRRRRGRAGRRLGAWPYVARRLPGPRRAAKRQRSG